MILSTSVIRKRHTNSYTQKTVIIYIFYSLTAILVNEIYALFGHGVHSPAMTYMFLYPLIGGCLIYGVIGLLIPKGNQLPGYRLFYNIYNSGIATLTVGSFLKGILEIAGTSSGYVGLFYTIGALFIAVAAIVFIVIVMRARGKEQRVI